MKINIKLLKPFSDAVGKKELKIEFNGNTLADLLKFLINKYPNLNKELYTKNNELSDHICIFVNDKPITTLNGINSKIKNDDEILFFIPLSGG